MLRSGAHLLFERRQVLRGPITERAAHRILSELVEEGYVLRERQGRRNRYQVKPELPLRHPLVQEREVGDLLKVLSES